MDFKAPTDFMQWTIVRKLNRDFFLKLAKMVKTIHTRFQWVVVEVNFLLRFLFWEKGTNVQGNLGKIRLQLHLLLWFTLSFKVLKGMTTNDLGELRGKNWEKIQIAENVHILHCFTLLVFFNLHNRSWGLFWPRRNITRHYLLIGWTYSFVTGSEMTPRLMLGSKTTPGPVTHRRIWSKKCSLQVRPYIPFGVQKYPKTLS